MEKNEARQGEKMRSYLDAKARKAFLQSCYFSEDLGKVRKWKIRECEGPEVRLCLAQV